MSACSAGLTDVCRFKLRISKTQENMLSNFNFQFPTENQKSTQIATKYYIVKYISNNLRQTCQSLTLGECRTTKAYQVIPNTEVAN